MLVGTFQGTKLYINGELQTFLSQKSDQDGVAPGNVSTMYASFPLPLEKIGEGLYAELADLEVYDRASLQKRRLPITQRSGKSQ